MAFGVPFHSNNESNLEDINIDNNIDDQDDDVEHVDCKDEDTVRGNDYGDTRKSSKRFQLGGEARTSRSLSHTLKKQLTQHGPDHALAQEVTIPIIIKRPQNK